MLTEQFEKLEAVLSVGCEDHLANGGNIIYGGFFDQEQGMDPIWASIDREAALKLATNLISKAHWGLIQALGFKMAELDMLSFCSGMDNGTNKGGDKMCCQ